MIRQITRLGLIFVVIAILIVIGVNHFTDDVSKKPMNLSTQALNVQQKEKVPSTYAAIDLYLETEKTADYKMDTLIPVTNSETINNNIQEWVEGEKQAFLNDIAEDTDVQSTFKLEVTVESETKHYDRLVFQTYTEKGDEKAQQEKVFNVDIESDKLLTLDDFLDVNDQTLQAIREHALDLLNQDEKITINENAHDAINTTPDNWEWFMSQEGLTFTFDGGAITQNTTDPVRINIPLQALYLHVQDNIDHYVQLSDDEKENMEKAIKEEEERILAAKREEEKREKEKAEAKKKQEQAANDSNGKYVALTFDDGPSEDVTPRVLDILDQYDAKATFFMLGKQVDYFPDLAKQVADAGHEIGNHTEQHQDLTKLGPDGVRQEIQSTSDKISQATGVRPYLMRPPYGAYNETVMNDAANHGDSIILWSIDSLDWQSRNADAINQEIQQSITPGSIVLMHDIHPTTADALPELMETLDKAGYEFVTVSQLMEIQGLDGVGPIYGTS